MQLRGSNSVGDSAGDSVGDSVGGNGSNDGDISRWLPWEDPKWALPKNRPITLEDGERVRGRMQAMMPRGVGALESYDPNILITEWTARALIHIP